MATYAIGDVQGCYDDLRRLLAECAFVPGQDRLWFAGDLVNRGPRSLEVLRFVADLGDRAVCVLGNHDLHLIARAAGVSRRKRRDTLEEVLSAPDCDELIGFLRTRALLHCEGAFAMVHAGLLPGWTLAEADRLAALASEALRGNETARLLSAYGDNAQDRFVSERAPDLQLQVVLNALTRLRVCTADGRMELSFTGPPEDAPPGLSPWFELWGAQSATMLFGHWATLGRRVTEHFVALDSRCVYGGELTAFRLEDRAVFSVRCPGWPSP